MASPLSSDMRWQDFDNLRHSIKGFTVDRLKHIITGINEECQLAIPKSGKKQDLIERITSQLDKMRYSNLPDRYDKARSVIYQVKSSGHYSHAVWGTGSPVGLRGTTAVDSGSGSLGYTHTVNHAHLPHKPSVPSAARYDPYAHQAQARRSVVTAAAAPISRPAVNTTIHFKSSPFFKMDQAVSSLVECPASTGSMDRQSQHLQFTLTPEQMGKLALSNYQLRLFCTSSVYYSPISTGYNQPCPIEFPPTCEVRVNNVQLTANLKGVRKKPGTAPPADLGTTVRMTTGATNRVEMVYINSTNDQHTGPTKKYYLLVALVEVTNVQQLVDRLRKGKYRSFDEIKGRLISSQNEDDEIVVGQQTISLKCPLSYTRIQTPCRSSKCVHPQCFDATSWYSIMEQTTTWLCPVCEHILSLEELIIDGFFDEILKKTPESIEEVVIEPDGEWHTVDKKYGSNIDVAMPPVKQTIKREVEWGLPTPSETSFSPGSQNGAQMSTPTTQPYPLPSISNPPTTLRPARGDGSEVVIIDSDDDEDERRISRELVRGPTGESQQSLPPPFVVSRRAPVADVIDLTSD